MNSYKAPRFTLISLAILLFSFSACSPNIDELKNEGNAEQLLKLYHKQKPEQRKDTEHALRDLSFQAVNEFAQDAKGVCSGNAMTGASTYVPNSSEPKPLVYVNTGDIYSENTVFKNLNHLPVDWLPYKRSDLQAVVCVRIERSRIQSCTYSGGASYTIERWKSTVDVTVHEAATGAVIGNFTFDGTDPDPCPNSVTVSATGTTIYDSDYKSIIKSVVENLAKLGFVIKS